MNAVSAPRTATFLLRAAAAFLLFATGCVDLDAPATGVEEEALLCPGIKNKNALLALRASPSCILDDDCPAGVECVCPTDAPCTPPQRICDHAPKTSCADDESCPVGAYCNLVQGICTFDCLEDAGPDYACTGTNVCDCSGRCVPPSQLPAPPPQHLADLRIDPPHGLVSSTDWAPRRFDLILEADTAAATAVYVDAGPDTLVSCGNEAGPYARRCPLPLINWSFAPFGNKQRATRTIWIKPEEESTATKWSVDVGGVIGTSNKQTAFIELVEAPPAVPSGPQKYVGSLTLMNGDALAPLTVPVKMWSLAKAYVFFDDLRLLARGGTFLIGREAGFFPMNRWIKSTEPRTDAATSQAFNNLRFEPDTLKFSGDRITGILDFDTGLSVDRFSLELRRTDPLTPQACPCSAGSYCEPTLAVCLPGDPWDGVDMVQYFVDAGIPLEIAKQLAAMLTGGPLSPSLTIAKRTDWGVAASDIKWYLWYKQKWHTALFSIPADQQDNVLLCFNPSVPANDLISTATLPISGDYKCTGGGGLPLRGVDLAGFRDRGQTATLSQAFKACVADLNQEPPAAWPNHSPSNLNETMSAAAVALRLERKTCLNKEFVFHAFGWARRTYNRRLLQRFAQQWAQVLGFVSQQGVHERQLADALGDDPVVDPAVRTQLNLTPTYESLIDTVDLGWRNLMNDDVLYGLTWATVPELRSPDYRNVGADPAHPELKNGLAVTLLESASSTLDLVASYLEDRRGSVYGECGTANQTATHALLDRAADGFRHAEFAAGVSRYHHDRAYNAGCVIDQDCGTGSTCSANVCTGFTPGGLSWEEPWQAALDEYETKRAAVVSAMTDITRCESPFGLAEDYIPLFFRESIDLVDRFFANSDYMLENWAVRVAGDATTRVGNIRSTWLQMGATEVQQQLDTDVRKDRVKKVQASYGSTLINICGLHSDTPSDVLGMFTSAEATLSEKNCYLTDEPQCNVDDGALQAKVTPGAARYTLCAWHELDQKLDLKPASYNGIDMKAAANNYLTATVANGVVNAGPITFQTDLLYVQPRGFEAVTTEEARAAEAYCQERLGKAEFLPAATDVNPALSTDADCYRGSLGEGILALHTSGAAMRAARGRVDAAQSTFKSQIAFCIDKQAFFTETDALRAKHRVAVKELQDELDAINRELAMTDWERGLISSPQSIALEMEKAIEDRLSGGAGSPFVTVDLRNRASSLQREINEANTAFDDMMTERSEDQQVVDCYHQADQMKTQIDTAVLDFRTAKAEFETARVRVANLRRAVLQTVAEGSAEVLREQASVGPDFAHPFWINQDVEEYRRELARARRFTYLAVLATEYDFQMSLPDKATVIAANHPSDLTPVLNHLTAIHAAPVIGDGEPEDAKIVLSVRDQLLHLTDQVVTDPTAPRPITKQERFRSRLLRDSARIYTDDGRYLGQGIRFALDEWDLRWWFCAERGWYVSADVSGTGLGTGTRTPLILLKNNAFYSQSCNSAPGTGNYQVGAVRMRFNPFLSDTSQGNAEVRERYSPAPLEATIGFPDENFGGPTDIGSSRAFGGRGMYGEYILVFPYNPQTGGYYINLNQVDDVRLRFDYIHGVNL